MSSSAPSKTVRGTPGRASRSDQPRLVEIASHSATAAQWNHTEYLKLFSSAPDAQASDARPKPTAVRTALVVEQDGSVVGFIVGRQVEGEWEIENIAVTVRRGGCGLGSRLVGEFLRSGPQPRRQDGFS